MNNPFSQPKIIHKIHFITNYKSIELFENFFLENTLGIVSYEVESETIDAQDNDLWSLEIYVEEKPDLQMLQKNLTAYANKHGALLASNITQESIVDKDWVTEYQKQLKPIIIGRFFVTSTMQQAMCPADKKPIFIEASRAFGTGDHATTSLCIEAMESLENNSFVNIFDVGTGSGILSFVGEKIWPQANILACDIEEISVEVAKDNLIVNDSKVKFYQNTESDLNIPEQWDQKFDLIISNILAQPLISMASAFKSLAHSGTKVILSGFLDYQQIEVENAYNSAGFVVETVLNKNKWISLTLAVKGR
jgi:ribosomal protein L11 methyltransferase